MADAGTAPRSPTSTPSPMSPSPTNPLKRKERPEEPETKPILTGNPLPSGAHPRPDEYEAGRVICETCGAGVSFRDEQTGGFTVNHWEAHRLTCPASAPPTGEPVIYTPENAVDSLSQPPSKRRRAKRTEEERIEYLRADPYVGQFEAYRVLCASCDKWIRLRPNSTYCSIPWDAHRKSCLAKKINNKNVYALEERNTLFSKDPDVRKFDPERLLCNMCDKWLSVPPDDHLQAVQKWLQHRASCQRTSGSSAAVPIQHLDQHAPGSSGGQAASTSQTHRPSASFSSTASGASPKAHPGQVQPPPRSGSGFPPTSMGSPSSFHDLNPTNYAPAHESRRRNAEQRAATLRADRLIGEVEPNRVFCTLCQKWVQLRQDSSYCAYPWLQHRGKCLARHQRRTQKAAEIADIKARKHHLQHSHHHGGVPMEEDELLSDREGTTGGDGPAPSDLESEEGVEADADADEEDRLRRKEAKQKEQRRMTTSEEHFRAAGSSTSRAHHQLHQHGHQHREHHRQLHPYPHPHPHSHHPHPHPHPHQQQHHHKSRSLPYGSQSRYPPNGSGGSMSQAVAAYRVNGSGVGGVDPRGPSSHPAHAHRSGAASSSAAAAAAAGGGAGASASARAWDEDADADGEPDAEGEYEPQTPPPSASGRPGPSSRGGIPRRPWPVGLADLDSPSGRKQFIFGSVEYMFATTYESTDDLSISALLAYLNAAMPQDKHEDFDTSEVARAVAAMKEKGRVVFEGDILRLID